MLQAHYRTTMEIDEAVLAGAAAGIDRLDAFARRVSALGERDATEQIAATDTARTAFADAMDNDLGTPAAVGVIFDVVRKGNVSLDRGETGAASTALATVRDLSIVLGLNLYPDTPERSVGTKVVGKTGADIVEARGSIKSGVPTISGRGIVIRLGPVDDTAAQELVDQRDAARRARDYATADRIRDELTGLGVELEDTPAGTIWRRVR